MNGCLASGFQEGGDNSRIHQHARDIAASVLHWMGWGRPWSVTTPDLEEWVFHRYRYTTWKRNLGLVRPWRKSLRTQLWEWCVHNYWFITIFRRFKALTLLTVVEELWSVNGLFKNVQSMHTWHFVHQWKRIYKRWHYQFQYYLYVGRWPLPPKKTILQSVTNTDFWLICGQILQGTLLMLGYLKGLVYATAAHEVAEMQQHVKYAMTFECVWQSMWHCTKLCMEMGRRHTEHSLLWQLQNN